MWFHEGMPDRRDFLMALSLLADDALGEEAPGGEPQSTIYIPERHSEKDRQLLHGFMEEYSFAMILTSAGGIRVTNVPTLLDRAESGWGRLWWHLAKSNPQNQAIEAGLESVVVFHGPHGYISPNWYSTANAVPTWNFAVVHAKGVPKRIDDDEAFAKSLARLVQTNESKYGGGTKWSYDKLPASYLKGMRNGIVAYEMVIESVEAKFKLGHERTEADRSGVLAGLEHAPKPRTLLELTKAYYGRLISARTPSAN